MTNIINDKRKLGIYTGTAKQFNLADKPKMMLILAYRGEEEHERLKKDSAAAQEKAKELGMDEIKVVMHNALIKVCVSKDGWLLKMTYELLANVFRELTKSCTPEALKAAIPVTVESSKSELIKKVLALKDLDKDELIEQFDAYKTYLMNFSIPAEADKNKLTSDQRVARGLLPCIQSSTGYVLKPTQHMAPRSYTMN